MKNYGKLRQLSLMIAGLTLSAQSSAAIILSSENPNQAPGVVTYAGGYPTPFNAPDAHSQLPIAQSQFSIFDDVRSAFMLDLSVLDANDEGSGGYENGLLDVYFSWVMGGEEKSFNYFSTAWSQIEQWQVQGTSNLSFWTDDNLAQNKILSEGDWTVHAFVEQTYIGGNSFTIVPEPSMIMGFGLMALGFAGIKRKK